MIGICLPSQSASSTIKKKSTQSFAHFVSFSKNASAMFDNHVRSCYFDYRISKPLSKANASEPLRSVLSRNQINRPYNLRSGSTIAAQITPRTKQFTDFVTIRYQDSV